MSDVMLGLQKATIKSSFITVKDNGTIEICHKLTMDVDGRTDYTRIYITKASAGIARAMLRKCGYSGDDFQDILDAIDADNEAMAGTSIEVNVFINDYNGKPKVEIVTERPKAGADALRRAAEMLRSSKGQTDDAGTAQGREDDIPF